MQIHVAISMGDPTGIGPEVIAGALASPIPDAICTVFGQRRVLDPLGLPPWVRLEPAGDPADALHLRWGHPQIQAGRLQVASLDRALDAVIEGRAHALCTAPISKAAALEAGFPFPGHTDYLAHRTGTRDYVMMLAGARLRVVPLTGHVPLRRVPELLTREMVIRGLVVTATALVNDFGVRRPHLALAALNPHAGEAGRIGDEEQRLLVPGLEQARQVLEHDGIEARFTGPLPSDALFVPPVPYDAVVCCYHDQALIPLKMLHRDDGVNITCGLPIVRTSPAHGTAPDIAGRNLANPGSMRAALELAVWLARRRMERPSAAVGFRSPSGAGPRETAP